MSMGAGLSSHADAVTAAEQACDAVGVSLGDGADPDLVIAFVSAHHAGLMGAIGDVVHRRLSPGALLAVSAEAVVSGRTELEGRPGVSILAGRLPGTTAKVFTSEDLVPVGDEDDPAVGERMANAIGADSDLAGILLFADPFSVPMVKLLPALSRMCRETIGLKRAPIVGGMASAGTSPGVNGLVVNKRLSRTGAIGVALRGAIGFDTVVSQGCKPFGPRFVITGAKHNVILNLSGRTALEALHEAVESLPQQDRSLLEKGVFLGRVINEYKERFGRGDYLMRNVLGVDQNRGALAVSDLVRVGQTVRFHVRDAVTADEDLRLLLSAQTLRGPALGAVLVTCNSRGTRLFDRPNHDAEVLADAIGGQAEPAGPDSGEPGPVASPNPALAGFFAAGEIGPIGSDVFLHGQTACAAIFRSSRSAELDD
jgi:small ligand-binding sensory domain FIST